MRLAIVRRVVFVVVALGVLGLGYLLSRHVGKSERWTELPVIMDIDGRESFVGAFYKLDKNPFYVAAYDAESVDPLWRYGGFKSGQYAISGDHVLISDQRAQLHIVDLRTGELVRLLPLTDHASRICVHGSTVLIGQVDQRAFALESPLGEPRDTQMPYGCARASPATAPGASGAEPPEFDGFAARGSTVDGELAVANGHAHPGTALPMAVGYDPASGEERWRLKFSTMNRHDVEAGSNKHHALAGGRFVSHYSDVNGRVHVVAIDARMGVRQWDELLRDIFAVDWVEGITLTGQFAYVLRTNSIDVLEAATGELLGTVGDETYD